MDIEYVYLHDEVFAGFIDRENSKRLIWMTPVIHFPNPTQRMTSDDLYPMSFYEGNNKTIAKDLRGKELEKNRRVVGRITVVYKNK